MLNRKEIEEIKAKSCPIDCPDCEDSGINAEERHSLIDSHLEALTLLEEARNALADIAGSTACYSFLKSSRMLDKLNNALGDE